MSKRKKRSKAHCERIHFKKRLHERFGLRINRYEYHDLVNDIKCGRTEFLYSQSNSRSVHRVQFGLQEKHLRQPLKFKLEGNTVELLVVYDNSRGELITVLPQGTTEEEIRDYRGD